MLVSPPGSFGLVIAVIALGILSLWGVSVSHNLDFFSSSDLEASSGNCPTRNWAGGAVAGHATRESVVKEPGQIISGWRLAHEPSLYVKTKSANGPVLRHFRLTEFGGPGYGLLMPIIIRIDEQPDGQFTLVTKISQRGADRGTYKIDERQMSAAEVQGLLAILAKHDPARIDPHPCFDGLDGHEWIFETVSRQGYRLIDRWMAEDDPDLNAIGAYFFRLTNSPMWNPRLQPTGA